MTLWWWYCCHCGWTTGDKREFAWADAAAIDHRETCHHGDAWKPYEVSISYRYGKGD